MPLPWPPQLEDVRRELKRADDDRADDPLLQSRLDAAVAWVEEQRADDFTFTGVPTATMPAPDAKVWLGTVLMVVRWHQRRASPDGLVDMGDLGSARVPSVDPDIERMLGVGRYRAPMVG